MESPENTFFNIDKKQEAGILLEDEPIENLDSVSYPNLLRKIEEEIISLREERGEDDEDYRAKILSRKEEFSAKLKEPNRIHLANILFGTEELILRDKTAQENGKKSESVKIEDVKFQQEVAYFIENNKDDFNLLEDYWDLYDDLFKVENNKTIVRGETLKHGILAPIALKNILDSKYNKNKDDKKESRMDFIYSTPKDDVKRSIDMIVIDKESKINMLIQVKGDAMNRRELEEMVKLKIKSNGNGKTNGSGEEKDLIYIIPENKFSKRDTSIKDEKINEFNGGCADYLDEHGKILKEEGFKTIGVYIYVPSVVDGERWIEINGQPHPKLEKLISGLLDLKLASIAKN